MFRPLAPSHRRPHRRGTSFILIVVVGISVFAVIGTLYALLAIQQAKLGMARKDAEGGGGIPPLRAPDPTDTVNTFLGTLIYDTGDSNADIFNALRGHSMARSMYGRDVSQFALGQPALTPWNGVGLFHEDVATGNYAVYGLTGDRARFINNTIAVVGGKPYLQDPEYTDHRYVGATGTAVPPFDLTVTPRNYVGKNAGYSYPDLKDFFAGAIDPVTGAVLVQSFHREWLFGSLDPLNGQTAGPGYVAAKNNWMNPQGALLTLRPRPLEDPGFPRVPPNADGTYTGDVQNFPGGYTYGPDATGKMGFHSRNDSLWMDLGLPIITLPGNRKVQPMVAPLIVPLDGLFNASAHGNNYGPSYAGYGPWEVSMAAALGGESTAVVTARQPLPPLPQPQVRAPLQQRNGANQRAYNPYNTSPLPNYAPVAWNATAAAPYPTYPSTNSFTGLPNFGPLGPPGPTGFQNQNTAEPNHPSLFNPTEWPGDSTAALRTFGIGDTKRVQRHSFTPDWYSQADVVPFAPTSLGGTPASYPYVFGTGQSTANAYRLDPAHTIRGLFTTRGYELDRPKVTPSFLSSQVSVAPGGKPVITAGPYPDPRTQAPGAGSDFAAADRWVNALAALGSVNLNRPLADYRDLNSVPNVTLDPKTGVKTLTPAPLSPTNMANMAQADSERQALANDIFVRLVASVGAATVSPTTGQVTIPAPGGPQYEVCRYLAQLAANIVDYIDNDDISTAFTWNKTAAGVPEVVYGVEKPRLVINEAYAEITNDPKDDPDGAFVGGVQQKPAKPAQVRFWLELLNPTSNLNPTGGTSGPLGTGTVPLSAYQVQIRRDNRQTVTAPTTADAPGSSAYQNQLVNNPSNTTGTFSDADVGGVSLGGAPITNVDPNDPTNVTTPAGRNPYDPSSAVPSNLPASGFVLVGPQVTAKTGGDEFVPAGGVWTPQNWIPAQLLYPVPLPAKNDTLSDPEFKRHVVLLQRLANPYAAAGPANPFITVDMMDYVPAFDAVNRGKNDGANRNPRDKTNTTGYDPVSDTDPTKNRFSVGKVQPYAGHSAATVTLGAGNYNAYTPLSNTTAVPPAPGSMVLPQSPPPVMPAPTPGIPQHTFGRHNSKGATRPGGPTASGNPVSLPNDTIMLPFDWLVHMDRPLVNQIELFQVRDSAPYRVTDRFIVPGGTTGVTYDAGVADWTSTTGLARGLEYLTVKSFTAGVPHGGRVPGKIAVNAVPDQRVITGLFDPQGGNGFNQGYVDSFVWQQWMGSRGTMQSRTLTNGTVADAATFPYQVPAPNSTPNPAPTPTTPAYLPAPSTTDDATLGVDKPFHSLGAPAATGAAGGLAFAYGSTAGGSEELTILRRNGNQKPLLYMTTGNNGGQGYPASLPGGPSYVQAEPLRKVFNNTTTVSHTYLVFLTIGYFDVLNENPPKPAGWPANLNPRPLRGAEAYITVPGDMRQKFVAMIDMSNMAVSASGGGQAAVQPFFTSLETTAYAPPPPVTTPPTPPTPVTLNIVTDASGNNVLADGTMVGIGTPLVLGYGLETQVVTVTAIPGPGQVTVTGMTRTAWAGTCVSNVRPGYAGPQPNFAYTTPAYKPVVPYVERLK